MNRDHPSEKPSTIEGYDASLHQEIAGFAGIFGAEGHFIEDEYREISVLRLEEKSVDGFRFIAGHPYKQVDREFILVFSSPNHGQAGLRKISVWPPYRGHQHSSSIDPKDAFAEIIATYKMIIEGNS